jgi:uncharacterized protein YgbK (DUF1537 family)
VACLSTIRIVADDLTGALDTAAAFAGVVPVFIDRPPALGESCVDAPVAVVATPTREVAPDALSLLLPPVLGWLESASLAFKKVDSLLRGNSFAEIAWLMRRGRFARAVFAPAFPAQGRVTVDDGQWLIRPGAARQGVAAPLSQIFAGLGLRSAEQFGAPDAELWIPQVSSDDDLDRVAAQAMSWPSLLWCGSAGLAHALARQSHLAPALASAPPLPPGAGPTLLVSASFQAVLREQWACLIAGQNNPALVRHACADEMKSALEFARQGAADLWFDLSAAAPMAPAQAASDLAAHAARLVAELPVPGQLVVVGGDTLLGLCRASGATALLAHPAVRPGWGCARLVGGRWDGVACYSRSGAFGGADDLLTMIRLLNGSDNRRKGN